MKSLMILMPFLIFPGKGMGQEELDVSGTFSPVGPPVGAPVRVDAGPTCIVDLTQRYEIEGGLTGRIEVDYRILVHGPCGSAAGTYDEEWIAHGTFEGSLNRERASGSFVYTADVRRRGGVEGKMVFGGGLKGELTIVGEFSEGELKYAGALEAVERPRSR